MLKSVPGEFLPVYCELFISVMISPGQLATNVHVYIACIITLYLSDLTFGFIHLTGRIFVD